MIFQPFQPRSAPRRSRRWLFFLFFFLTGLLLIGLVYFFFYSDFLRVREISLDGNKLISEAEIKSAAIQVLASENIFWRRWLGTDHILFWHQPATAIVANQLPLLADIRIAADWRSKKVSITVSERTSAGVWCFQESQDCFLFDRAGFIFAPAPVVSGSLILKVWDENPAAVWLGQPVLAEAREREEFFAVLEFLRQSDLGVNSVIIKPTADQEWAVKLAAGPELRLNWLVPVAASLPALAEKIGALPLAKIGYIDLTVPNRLYYQ